MKDKNEVIIFNETGNAIEVKLSPEDDTVWLTQDQMSTLFDVDRTRILRHISNIYQEGELSVNSTFAESAQVQIEGDRQVTRKIKLYNLDMIISVGYRVKSKNGIIFRKWATSILKNYAIKGAAINKSKLGNKTYLELLGVMKRTTDQIESKEILNVLELYTKGLMLLDDYDHQNIKKIKQGNKPTYRLTVEECKTLIDSMRNFKCESCLFGVEREYGMASSIESLYQTFDGVELYPTLEEKCANLLYFLVKNHSFVDGNKRIAAAIFVYFLNKNNVLIVNNHLVIDNNTLAAMTIMIAESNPKEKETMINLVIQLLN